MTEAEYLARRKKKKNNELKNNPFKSVSKDESDDIAPVKPSLRKTISTSNIIAPIVSVPQKKTVTDSVRNVLYGKDEEIKPYLKRATEGWFQKGALGDGFSKSNLKKTVGGSATDVAEHSVSGTVNWGERVLDWLMDFSNTQAQSQLNEQALSQLALSPITGENPDKVVKRNEELKSTINKGTVDFIKEDLWDGEAIAKQIITNPVKERYDIDAETDSIFGDKSDALVEAFADIIVRKGLETIHPALGKVSAFGSSYGGQLEAALNDGADISEARASALISGGAEVLYEQLSGGIKFKGLGGKTLDDFTTKKLSGKIANETLRNLTNIGLDIFGEGFEEVLTEVTSRLGTKIYKEEDVSEILASEEALDSYIQAFISGGIMGGAFSTIDAIKNRNAIELSDNEQKVFDRLVEDEISEAEKNGTELTDKDKQKINKDMFNRLVRGEVDIETIEEVLGGKEYEAYKSLTDRQNELQSKYDELYKMPGKERSYEQEDIFNSLKGELDNFKATNTEHINKLRESIRSKFAGDSLLQESYNEKARRGQYFEADVSKYDTKQQATIQKAIDSGILNNTRKTHEFVDLISKISADKGVPFNFADNEKIKKSGFAVEGATVNGYVDENGEVTLNVNSAKALNSVVGHEITHILEGTELYDALQKSIIKYAESKGDYTSRVELIKDLYKTEDENKINSELTADLVGDYLFSDEDFIRNLSVNNRNVFQKIYDEIKYLCKVATAGSKEARELEKVKKAFEKVYKESKTETETDADVKYSISRIIGESGTDYGIGVNLDSDLLTGLSETERKQMVKARVVEELAGQSVIAYDSNNNPVEISFAEKSEKIKTKSGKKKPVLKELYNKNINQEIKQEAVVLADELIATSVYNGSNVATNRHDWLDNNGKNKWDNRTVYVQDTNKAVWEATLHIANSQDGRKILYDIDPIKMVEGARKSAPTTTEDNVPQNSEKVKKQFSLSNPATDQTYLDAVNRGETETAQKIVDDVARENGYNLKLYHQTENDFTVFETKRNGSGSSDYQTPHGIFLKPHANDIGLKGKNQMPLYVKINDPLTLQHREGLAIWLDANIKGYSDKKAQLDSINHKYEEMAAQSRQAIRDYLIEYRKNNSNEARRNIQEDAEFIRLHQESDNTLNSWSEAINKKSAEMKQMIDEYFANSEYDGIHLVSDVGSFGRQVETWVAFSPEQVKSADAVTYDNDGKVIPLSERFNLTNNDIRFSLSADSEGNNLSEKQADYFKNSKVRDENGNLKMVYHGSGTEFTEFSYDFMSSHGSSEGQGFYFTDRKAMAEGYQKNGTKLMSGYLDISNPLSDSEITLTKREIEKLLRVVDPTGDDVVINYDASGMGYPSKVWYERALSEAVNSIYQYSESDSEILAQISNSGAGAEAVLSNVKKVLGYDGYIVNDKYDNATVYVAFESNQFKNADNLKPTDNPDVNLSLSEKDKTQKPYGNYNVYGKDMLIEKDDIAPVIKSQADVFEDYAPLTETEATEGNVERLSSLGDDDAPPERVRQAPVIDDEHTTSIGKKDISEITQTIKKILPIRAKQTQQLHDIIQEYSTDEFKDRDVLYQKIKEAFGQVGETHVDSDIAEAKRLLRGVMINVTEEIKSDIPDYADYVKKHFGKLRISKDGLSVDDVYTELSRNYPNFFPDDVINPSDQFLLMGSVSDMSTETTEYTDVPDRKLKIATDMIMSEVERIHDVEYKKLANQRTTNAEWQNLTKTAPTDDIAPVREFKKSKQKSQNGTQVESKQDTSVAKILVEEPETSKKRNRTWELFTTNFVDKATPFETLALKTGNRELDAKYNSIRYAERKAQRTIENIKDISTEIEDKGLTGLLYQYMYHKYNVDRMTLSDRFGEVSNKPVFGENITARESQAIVDRFEKENPQLTEYAEQIWNINKKLRTLLVEGDVISQETADLWEEMYPHYVPIRRDIDDNHKINFPLDSKKVSVKAPIQKATGGSENILPLFETMAQRTIQTYKAIAKNRFGVELKNTLNTTIDNAETSLDEIIDGIDSHEELLQKGMNGKNPTFTVFENGKKVTFEITEQMFDALKPVSEGLAQTFKLPSVASNVFRGLTTNYNPAFLLTNPIKDSQDVLINSQHPIKTYANFPKAIEELATKGKWYNEYMENGGEDNSYFDRQTNTFTEEKSGLSKAIGMPLEAIGKANDFIERIPRLAEYIASRESGRSVDVSMLDAARVTTNFSAGGDVTKFLNRNGATFLNASVQGAVQQVRNVREAKANGLKGWVQLATKVALAGLPTMLLNGLLWDDDDEYEELSDYVKESYYIVAKTQDGKFIRIPKGRTLAVIQSAFEQVSNALTGDDEVDLQAFLELAINNLAPNNPVDNNIIAPIVQAYKNTTWYGEDLVPIRLQDLPNKEQYDESTDSISKWLGEKLNLSPYKINYLLNQYSGGLGDVVLPMLTPEAESGDNSLLGNAIAPIKSKFSTDATFNNQNVSDFYKVSDELTTNAKSSEATDEDVLKYKYFNSISSELSDLYKEKRAVQSDSSLNDTTKYERVREIQTKINSITREALNNYQNASVQGKYALVGDKHYYLNSDNEWQKITDEQLEKQNDVTDILGITPSQYWSNKSEYDMKAFYPEKYAVLREQGISVEDYKENYQESTFLYTDDYSWASENPEKYTLSKSITSDISEYKQYTSDLYNIKADKDSNGKSISGSAKKKKRAYIYNLDIDEGAKHILFKSVYPSEDEHNNEIIEYLNNRDDISYDEMETILKELGFNVSADGDITWD